MQTIISEIFFKAIITKLGHLIKYINIHTTLFVSKTESKKEKR